MFWVVVTHYSPAVQPQLFLRGLQNLPAGVGQYAWSRRDNSCRSCLDTRHLRRDRVCEQGWRDGCSSRSLYPAQSVINKKKSRGSIIIFRDGITNLQLGIRNPPIFSQIIRNPNPHFQCGFCESGSESAIFFIQVMNLLGIV